MISFIIKYWFSTIQYFFIQFFLNQMVIILFKIKNP